MNAQVKTELIEYHKQQIEFHEALIATHTEALNHGNSQLDLHRRFVESLQQSELQLELGKQEE